LIAQIEYKCLEVPEMKKLLIEIDNSRKFEGQFKNYLIQAKDEEIVEIDIESL
jgi:hypothetical protein